MNKMNAPSGAQGVAYLRVSRDMQETAILGNKLAPERRFELQHGLHDRAHFELADRIPFVGQIGVVVQSEELKDIGVRSV